MLGEMLCNDDDDFPETKFVERSGYPFTHIRIKYRNCSFCTMMAAILEYIEEG